MKKIITFVILMFLINFNISSLEASTKIYNRSEDDLQINSRINITEKVKKAALATPKVDASEKIYDFANLFSDEEEIYLYNYVSDFINTYNLDMAIVTINKNNKSSSEAYADDFYDYNDFGCGSTFDGLLFLVDMDERMMHITTTGQAILIYDDYRIQRMLDDAYFFISAEDYYTTAKSFVMKAKEYAESGVPNSNKNYVIDADGNYKRVNVYNVELIFIVTGIITAVFLVVTVSKHKLVKKATNARQYLIRNSIILTENVDQFITSNTTKIYTPPSSSSSGGGSSTHSSSSGGSHGGGSRRF